MVDFIRPIQCRRLLDCWKLIINWCNSVDTDFEDFVFFFFRFNDPVCRPQAPHLLQAFPRPLLYVLSSTITMSTYTVNKNWPETFQVNWNKMHTCNANVCERASRWKQKTKKPHCSALLRACQTNTWYYNPNCKAILTNQKPLFINIVEKMCVCTVCVSM